MSVVRRVSFAFAEDRDMGGRAVWPYLDVDLCTLAVIFGFCPNFA